jgi:glycerol uptake operon antiterminator
VNKLLKLLDILGENPIIAAIKDEETLKSALKSDIKVIFILKSSILTIEDMIHQIKAKEKKVFVHIDLIDGMSPTVSALEFLKQKTRLDGVITTKPNIIKTAKKLGLLTIQRFFILDSISYKNCLKHSRETKPDIVEILPGAMPKIIKRFLYNYKCPLIASGIIMDKEDVISALKAGAIGVSTTKSDIWNL